MSESKKRVLVVGVGSIGERHVRCFLATGRCEVIIAEANPQLREQIATKYGVRSFPTLEQGLNEPLHAAVIATPAQLHIAMARQVIARGLDVLVEKPLSTSLAGVDELIQAANSEKRVAGVAYVYRVFPLLEKLRAKVRGGECGAPVQYIAVTGQHFPTFRPAYREIYYRDRATGGGAIQDALTHTVNAAEWIVGPASRLVVDADHLVLDGVSVEDTVHLVARHGNVMASYILNQHQAPNETTFTIVCERGTVRAEFHRQRLSWMDRPGADWQEELLEPVDRDANFIRQADAFLSAVESRGPCPCSLAEGLQTLRVNLAALESLESGCWRSV